MSMKKGVCLLFRHGVVSHIVQNKKWPPPWSIKEVTLNPFLMRDVAGKDFRPCTRLKY